MKQLVKILLGFNLIALKHLIHMEFRRCLYACRSAFSSARNVGSCELAQIPEISLGEVLGERHPVIRLCVKQYEDGTLPSDQAMALLSILVAESPDEVLEIGTYMGHTTRQMAENLPKATIHTVDLPGSVSAKNGTQPHLPKDDFHLIDRRVVGREFKGQACADRIRQHVADTASWDFHSAGHPTFFFIDGSHTYEYGKNDSEKCFALCGGRGVFLWHDCDDTHPGVVRLVLEWRHQGRDIRRISGTSIAYWKSG